MAEIPTPFNPLPDFPLCVCVPLPPEEICLNLPFGVEVCSTRTSALRYQGLDSLMLNFVANLQPLLAPFMPILVLASFVKALYDCVNSIKDAISSLSIDPVIECLERLAELLPKLFQMIPPFNYLVLILNLVLFFNTVLETLIDILEQALNIDLSLELDLMPDDARLRCCLDGNITAFLEQIAMALRNLGPIFGLFGTLLELLAIPGMEKPIKRFAEAIKSLADLSASDLTPGLVDQLKEIQSILNEIATVLGPIVAVWQKANNCDCD